MNIICLSQDNVLIKKIVALYGPDNLKSYADYRLMEQNDLQKCDVMVVDLKDCLLPKSDTFTSPIMTLAEIPTFQEAVVVLQCGAKGYGNRHMRGSNLRQAIESVQAGQIWLPPSVITKLVAQVSAHSTAQADNPVLAQVSKREQEVALYVAQGMSNQEIADKMYVSLRTVKAHLSSIYDKTGLRNRLELGLRVKG